MNLIFPQVRRRGLSAALAVLSLGAAAGCSSISPVSATAFSTGVVAARAQTTTAFMGVSKLTRDDAKERAIATGKLNETELEGFPNQQAVDAWNGALAPIEDYAHNLAALASGGYVGDVEQSIGRLATSFNATAPQLGTNSPAPGTPPLTATRTAALAEAAGAFLRARSTKEASGIAAKTHPQIREILTRLADEIGADPKKGIRRLVGEHWRARLRDLEDQFTDAKAPDQRRPILDKYTAILDQRSADDSQLASLRRSYLALIDAHAALAQGNAVDLHSAVDLIYSEFKHAQDLQTQFSKKP